LNDTLIIQSVCEGVQIDKCARPPFQAHSRGNLQMGKDQLEIRDQEVKSLLEKGAIEPIEPGGAFISGLLLIPKPTGGFRPVVDLKALNEFIWPVHLKMEGIPLLEELIHPVDLFTKIDLKGAYLTLALRKENRKFVQIKWGREPGLRHC
jgi:hypothetical protein